MPFITITYPPKYQLTESEKKWLHERKKVKGWAFCLHCTNGKKAFPCAIWCKNLCPVDGALDFSDAAEFEARVSRCVTICSKLTISDIPFECVKKQSIQELVLMAASLQVEQEMDRP